MIATEALKRLWRVLIPSLILLSGVVHHHDSAEEAEHCDYCTTVVDGRRRPSAKPPVQQLVAGGRPGPEPHLVASIGHQLTAAALPPQTVSVESRPILERAQDQPETPPQGQPKEPPTDQAPRGPPTFALS